MKVKRLVLAGTAVTASLLSSTYGIAAGSNTVGSEKIKHVLLLSIDGMHAVDFYNCAHGIAGCEQRESVLPEPGRIEPGRRSIMWPPRRQSLRTPFPDSWRW